jgi:hypothetical protein
LVVKRVGFFFFFIVSLAINQSVKVTGRIFPPLLSAAAAANVGTLGVAGDGWGIAVMVGTSWRRFGSRAANCQPMRRFFFFRRDWSVGCTLVLIMAIMVMMMSSWRLANAERERGTVRKRQSIVMFDRTKQRNLE